MNLNDLPDEVILNIFTYLSTKDLGRCACVSKRFKSISKTESLWCDREIPEKTTDGLDLLIYQYDRGGIYSSSVYAPQDQYDRSRDTGKSLSEALFFADHGDNMLCTKIVLNVRNNFCTQHVLPRFELGIFMH